MFRPDGWVPPRKARAIVVSCPVPDRPGPGTRPAAAAAGLELADRPDPGRAGGGPAHRHRGGSPVRHPGPVPAEPAHLLRPGGFGDPAVTTTSLSPPVGRDGRCCDCFPATWGPPTALGLWVVAALALLVGYRPRIAALVCWVLAVSFRKSNRLPAQRRRPTQAVSAADAQLPAVRTAAGRFAVTRWRASRPGPVLVQPWPLRLLMLQLTIMYFMNGYYKAMGPAWRDGSVMTDVANNPSWTHFSPNYLPMPDEALQALAWGTIAWELLFPLLVLMPLTRKVDALDRRLVPRWYAGAPGGGLVSAVFALCYYMPLVAWERNGRSYERSPVQSEDPRSPVGLRRLAESYIYDFATPSRECSPSGRASAGPRPSCAPCRSPCPSASGRPGRSARTPGSSCRPGSSRRGTRRTAGRRRAGRRRRRESPVSTASFVSASSTTTATSRRAGWCLRDRRVREPLRHRGQERVQVEVGDQHRSLREPERERRLRVQLAERADRLRRRRAARPPGRGAGTARPSSPGTSRRAGAARPRVVRRPPSGRRSRARPALGPAGRPTPRPVRRRTARSPAAAARRASASAGCGRNTAPSSNSVTVSACFRFSAAASSRFVSRLLRITDRSGLIGLTSSTHVRRRRPSFASRSLAVSEYVTHSCKPGVGEQVADRSSSSSARLFRCGGSSPESSVAGSRS